MDYSKPTLLVISGPNGAGKSTYISSMLPAEFGDITSFDRDRTRSNFEDQLRGEGATLPLLEVKATRMMEEVLVQIMDEAIKRKSLKLHYPIPTTRSILTGSNIMISRSV